MLIALHYCRKDQHLASKLAEWLDELGPFPNHQFLIARERGTDPMVFIGRKNLPVFNEIVIADDVTNAWPASANHAFKKIAKYVQHVCKGVPFLYLEPDAVILRASAFDEIEAEYKSALASGKPFLGDLIDHRKQLPGSVLHMSGIGVYPGNMARHAGEVFYADENTPFDIAAGPAIHSQAKQSELIFHVWNQQGQGLAPFTSWQDVEQKIFARRPKCAIFHSDKTGTLIGLLRERKDGVAKLADAPLHTVEGARVSEEAVQSPQKLREGSSPSPISHTSQPENSAETKTLKLEGAPVQSATKVFTLPDLSKCGSGTLEMSWHDQAPWGNKESSLIEIRRIATRLRQFQTAPMTTHQVRSLLAAAGVIKMPVKRRKKRK